MPDENLQRCCNICGGSVTGRGPADRLSVSGQLPRCIACGSLERHRLNRSLFQRVPIGALSWRRALQFSPDIALSPQWFSAFEVSVYGGVNSLDLQAIDRPDESYDFISMSHVLEFVQDDHAAFTEAMRVLSPDGLMHLVLSAPLGRPLSEDFVVATGIHQYFHLYGRDFAKRFKLAERGLHMLVVKMPDPVTSDIEAVHLIAKSNTQLQGLREILRATATRALLHGGASTFAPELI